MARYSGSPFGTVLGNLLDLTASTWKGIRYLKERPKTYNDANTTSQKKQRAKFKTLNQYGQLAARLIKIGFKKQAVGMTQANYFVKANGNAVTVDDNLSVTTEWNQIIISQGTIEGSGGSLSASRTAATVSVSWLESADAERNQDKVYVAARIEEAASLIEELASVARDAEAITLTLPTTPTAGTTLWLFFVDPVTGRCSDSEAISIA